MADGFGELFAKKYKLFDKLPNIIFFNLKRYTFRKDKNKQTKILTEF